MTDRTVPELDAVIIGAGFSGLYMLHHARDVLGLQAVVYEAGDGVGGTWYWNRYPGARCDSESYYYSFSFSEELEQEWEWSSKYPEQPEILRYLNHVADRFDLRRDIRLGTRVAAAAFDEATDRWEVTTETGERVRAQFLISAVGCLSTANVPDIPGLDRFEGDWYHTGAWPHDGVDFAGKRVGLIGTGSTGIQATPVIAREAAHLTVFQRTPNYSVPARNAPLSPDAAADIKANYREIRRMARESFGGFPFAPSSRSALEVTPEERQATYEALWEEGGFKFLYGSYYDIVINEEANETAAEFIRDDVTLVDLKESPIVEITPTGVRTSAGDHDLDVIVFATGFDAMTGSLLRIDIRGRGGRTLADAWSAGPRTYLGLQVAGFPNLFTITGPGSPSVLSNMPVSIEQHVEWIGGCIAHLREHGFTRIEPTEEAQEAWVAHVAEVASMTLFQKASSWYLGANIPGKTRVFMPYVGGVLPYRQRCDAVAANGYDGFALTP